MKRALLAVCCSGNGTNLQALLGASRRGTLQAKVAIVVSDDPRAYALKRALAAKIPAVVIAPKAYRSRQAFDRQLARVIDRYGARLVVLAGFMRLLSPWFVRRFRGRLLNIHPALLPSFSGAHAVRDALDHGVKVTGVTVHFVDEKMDHGPIILQAAVPIRETDTEKSLQSRLHKTEHQLYPKAIQMVLDGKVRVRGRIVQIRH